MKSLRLKETSEKYITKFWTFLELKWLNGLNCRMYPRRNTSVIFPKGLVELALRAALELLQFPKPAVQLRYFASFFKKKLVQFI